MDGHFLHEFKRQASFFFKDKIKVARLALLDVTPAQLSTEEATNGDSSAPDARTMRLISRAAFEVDDYWRIVDVLHRRLQNYDRHNWRAAYQAMILLEHLLTHGPARVAEEFQGDRDIIREMANLSYIDEKGFDWGLSVQKKAERVLKLIKDGSFLKEERAREQKLTVGIKGFGSFCERSILTDESSKCAYSDKYLRCHSHFCERQSTEDALLAADDERIPNAQEIRNRHRNLTTENPAQNSDANRTFEENDHPFYGKEDQALVSLLSSG
nr:ENTH domain-containing protein C794.11c-like [Coffea arabica]